MVTVGEARSDGAANKSIQIFQSYGWRDATEIALRLKASLAEAGYDVWLDREKLESDDRHFSIALADAITKCNLVLALLSPHSVRGANEEDERSSICYNELLLAEELSRPILPIKVQELSRAMPFLINKYNTVMWLDWQLPDRYQKGLDRIIALIEEVLATGTNFDPKLNLQALRFTQELHTAENVFVGRAWLFEQLHAWLSSNQPCFMIEGATGSGKTTFAAELARRNPQGRIVAFHFCNAAPETRNPATFVESVASMLFKNVEAYKNLYLNEDFGVLLKKVGPEMAFSEAVLAPLHKVEMDTPCYIVVDALDEAIDAADDAAISLPQLLAHALAEFPPWLKLMVTTRSNAGIKQMFQLAETVVLGDGSRDHRMDLRAYLDKRLAELDVDLEQPDRAASLIENRVTGSFQYASNVIDALQAHDVDLQQLDRLPSSLEDFYVKRAERRFRNAPDYSNARITLELLLAAREPLTSRQLTKLSGLNQDAALHPTLDKLSCFVSANTPRGGLTTHQMAHKSITDWLLSGAAGRFQIDPEPGRERILAHCREWRAHKDPYALRHLIAHLLEGGGHGEAVQLINQGFFTERHAHLDRRQLDTEDSRSVTVALVSAKDKATILALARTENTWQRDGIALALQTSDPKDRTFVDDVCRALLELKL